MASKTSIDLIDFMQLWCLRGQVRFMQGWHSKFFLTTMLFSNFHCEVSLKFVGPNIETVGIWKLAARCMGPLSAVINKSKLEILITSSSIVVFPARFL